MKFDRPDRFSMFIKRISAARMLKIPYLNTKFETLSTLIVLSAEEVIR